MTSKEIEVLNRDNRTCQRCGTNGHLVVYPIVYRKMKQLHEYDTKELITLCEDCKVHEHITMPKAIDMLATNVRLSGMLSDDIIKLASYHDRSGL